MNYTNFKNINDIGTYGPFEVNGIVKNMCYRGIYFENKDYTGGITVYNLFGEPNNAVIHIEIKNIGYVFYNIEDKEVTEKIMINKDIFLEKLRKIDRSLIDVPAFVFADLMADRN